MKTSPRAKSTFVASGNAGAGTLETEQTSTPKVATARAAKRPRGKAQAASAGSSQPGNIQIEFLNATAREVFIAGTFNGWDPLATPLKAQGEGKWGVELTLQPGRYEYRFVVDGQWTQDPKSPEYTPNPYGEMNSVLQI